MLGSTEVHIARKKAFQLPVLVVLFILSFSLPIYFGLQYSADGKLGGFSDSIESGISSLIADGPGSYISIEHHPSFLPETENGATLFYFLFRPKKPPLPGQTSYILQKIETRANKKFGYAFGYQRDEAAVYPVAFWSDKDGNGKLFRFESITILPKQWHFLAFSYTKGKLLGAYYSPLSEQGESHLERLGGYDLSDIGPAYSTAALSYGSRKNGEYRGQLGSLGMLSLEETDDTLEVLEQIVRNPNEVPSAVDLDRVILFTSNGSSDSGNLAHKLEARGGVLGKKKSKRGVR